MLDRRARRVGPGSQTATSAGPVYSDAKVPESFRPTWSPVRNINRKVVSGPRGGTTYPFGPTNTRSAIARSVFVRNARKSLHPA